MRRSKAAPLGDMAGGLKTLETDSSLSLPSTSAPHKVRTLQPSGYDMDPALAPVCSDQTDFNVQPACVDANTPSPAAAQDADLPLPSAAQDAGDAFQQQIPSIKKQQDAVVQILEGMKEHNAHPGVVKMCCRVLNTLSTADDANDEKIARAGGIKLILDAIRGQHKMNTGILENACKALKNLAANEDNQVGIAREGGITTILDAMRVHMQDASIQEHGCGTLVNLTGNNNHHNKKLVASQGGILVILEAMRAHPKRAETQHHGCTVLMSLTYNNDDNKKQIAESQGIEDILKAMHNHQNHTGVQERACGVLDNLAWSDKTIQKCIKDAGAMDLVEAAIATHFTGSTSACRRYGQHLLENLLTV